MEKNKTVNLKMLMFNMEYRVTDSTLFSVFRFSDWCRLFLQNMGNVVLRQEFHS